MGIDHHSGSGGPHRRHSSRDHARASSKNHHASVPVSRPHAAPPAGQPVAGQPVAGRAPSGHKHSHRHKEEWPPPSSGKRRRRRPNTALASLAIVLLAVGCMAAGWFAVRSFTGGSTKDRAKKGTATPTQIAQLDPSKVTEKEANPAPMPAPMPMPEKAKTPEEAKPADPKPPEPKPPEPKPPEPKPPEPKPPEPKPPEATTVSYDKDLKPLFLKHCLRCHGDGAAAPKGKFDMKTIAAMTKGGTSGDPGLVPGNPEKSTVWTEIKEGSMPPKGEGTLTDEEKKKVFDWIKGGAKEKLEVAMVVSFEKHVLPILKANCAKCHDADKPKSDFSVLSLAAIKKGGSSGKPGVAPGDLAKSNMWQMIADKNMPPDDSGFALEPKDRDMIEKWIKQGAKDDKEAAAAAAAS